MSGKAIEILEKLEGGLSHDSAAVTAVRIDDPVAAVESSLTTFVTDSMAEVKETRDLKRDVRDIIMTRINEANVSRIMDFYHDLQMGDTAATSTIINPIAAIHQARVHAEVETRQYQTPDAIMEDKLFQRSTKDVLQGIMQLNQLLTRVQEAQLEPPVLAKIIKDDEKKKF